MMKWNNWQNRRRLKEVVTLIQEPDRRCLHLFADLKWEYAPGEGMILRCHGCGYAVLSRYEYAD